MTSTVGEGAAVRPFRVDVPEEDLVDLRRRIAATRWPDRETVPDRSQGAQLAELQELVRYWGTDYDWRKGEAKLNAWPQFMTEIDGVDVHFFHVRSRHENAMPLIISHGWPGSVFEQIKVIGPLTDPTAFGGRAEDAFDVVILSLPGFGFSSRPTEVGWGLERVGRAWDVLMKRLGYTRYVAQGGDWGGGIVEVMARQAPDGLLGIHTNLAATFPPDAAEAIASGGPTPAGLSEKERAEFDALRGFLEGGGWAYLTMMSSRPQAVGYGMTDSPAGLAAFMLVHGGFGQWSYGKDPDQTPTKDEVLDDISLYWPFKARKIEEGLNPNTVGVMQGVLSVALNQAVDDGLIPSNPALSSQEGSHPREAADALTVPRGGLPTYRGGLGHSRRSSDRPRSAYRDAPGRARRLEVGGSPAREPWQAHHHRLALRRYPHEDARLHHQDRRGAPHPYRTAHSRGPQGPPRQAAPVAHGREVLG